MPIYEYWCSDCARRVSIFWPTVAAATAERAVCPRCAGVRLDRLLSRVAFVRSAEARMDGLADPDSLSALESEDPRAMARWMRQMGDAAGEDLGEEFGEMVDRLEAGEDPDSAAQALEAEGNPEGDE